jgi:hypothetical protein
VDAVSPRRLHRGKPLKFIPDSLPSCLPVTDFPPYPGALVHQKELFDSKRKERAALQQALDSGSFLCKLCRRQYRSKGAMDSHRAECGGVPPRSTVLAPAKALKALIPGVRAHSLALLFQVCLPGVLIPCPCVQTSLDGGKGRQSSARSLGLGGPPCTFGATALCRQAAFVAAQSCVALIVGVFVSVVLGPFVHRGVLFSSVFPVVSRYPQFMWL